MLNILRSAYVSPQYVMRNALPTPLSLRHYLFNDNTNSTAELHQRRRALHGYTRYAL